MYSMKPPLFSWPPAPSIAARTVTVVVSSRVRLPGVMPRRRMSSLKEVRVRGWAIFGSALDWARGEDAESLDARIDTILKFVLTGLVNRTHADDDREYWLALSADSLARAYADDEIEYSLSMIKEANPAYVP